MEVITTFKKILTSLFAKPAASAAELPAREVPQFPSYICLETTNACNLRCVQCLYKGGTTEHYHGKVGFIDINLAQKILDELKVHNTGVMLNGDGEALLHPEFHQIAGYAVSLGLPSVYFNTNGTLFTRAFTDKFVTYFKGSVSISLDGFKESHERIRVGSSYDLVIDNIKYLQERIQQTGADIKIGVAYCNYDQPAGERDAFVEYWVDKVDVVSIGEVYDKDYRMISNQLNRPEDPKRVMCGVPWQTFIVRWDGKVIPCSNCFSLDDTDDQILGDALTHSLYDIWHGAKSSLLRAKTEAWELQGTICEACDRWNMYVLFETEEQDDVTISRSGVFTTYRRKGIQ